ncbi:MAG: outer membrane beta-barrel protein [Chlorobi bacterium]|nr:outer membrane beta-barrel protein [Chlorobiota bacterium]
MNFKIKSTIITIILTIFWFTISINGQGTIIPLMQNGWVGGLSGNLGWDNYSINASNSLLNVDSKVKGFNFTISSRNGRFVENNAVIGFDLQWEQKNSTITPQNNIVSSESYEKEQLGFIGLWMRYYIPFIGTGWAIYPEASAGYGNFKSVSERRVNNFTSKNNASADGFVYNVGLGTAIFVSNNIAFEATARYQGGKLKGDYEFTGQTLDNLEIRLSNIDVLFGIMIYMR